MNSLLEKVITKVQKLPEGDQDAIAQIILDELKDEERWQESFQNSRKKLDKLAIKVRKDIKENRIKKMGIDDL